ncbi:GBF-interacting protein 1-like isoform X3 [Argentina anserina]|uniref:GBF-interacting protein 1-like isoform X3 n=1 Tax=Argentina anserina TaxID=57926 RepID=UPI0021762DC1|nr:GBF-interacting protein 1-like isoform X3 [Potentilla anserina]
MTSGGGFRVSSPTSVRKTIQDIKEITGNHSEDEIYAMLKECNMDPNETVQKLLLQDPFHEVKRKRDKRKENLNNKESAEPRWRPGMQGKGARGGRGNFSARHISHDAGGGRNSGPGTENGPAQVTEKGVAPSLPTSRETKTKERNLTTRTVPAIVGGPTNVVSGTTTMGPTSKSSSGTSADISLSLIGDNPGSLASPEDAKKDPRSAFGNEDLHEQAAPSSSSNSALPNPVSTLGVCFSSSDPVLVPSNDSRLPGSVGTIKREVATSEVGSSLAHGKTSKTLGVGKNQASDISHPSSTSTHGGSVSRPSSNYSSRSQQLTGTQKAVGTNKEWKPKPIVPAVVQGQATANIAASEVPADLVEVPSQSQPVSSVLDSEDATSKLQKKLDELQLPQRKLVILPNHIHVPESERNKLSFGSFGATFGVTNSYVSGPESEKSSTPRSETSQVIEESAEEQSSSNQYVLASADESDFPDCPQSPTQILENLSSGEGDVTSSAAQGHNEHKHDTVLASGGHQLPVANTAPNYSFGIVPPILGSQLAAFENSESQARDISRLPSFVVQQPFDPASYYAQFYRSGADSDGHLSPFPSPGVSTKYNGNVGVLPPSSLSPQEGGVLSAAGPTPLVTQASGLVQSSIAVTQQQPVPVFRSPAGMHISHYPNYIPYGHYYNPFYVPPPIHQYLGNGAFPQQPQAGGVYPAPPTAAATGVKYSLPQYKAGTNTGNSNHMGMASGYGPYGSSPAGYNPSPATTAGNTTTNEDLSTSQFKENNVYITGQQSEGSSVWIAAPNREMPSLTSSFYNLPTQSQHVTFTPTQASHGTFAGLYHPAQAVSAAAVHPLLQQSQPMAGAVDMVGPGGNVYQQPQHAQQMNWPSNY